MSNMSEFDDLAGVPDSNSVDNGFEKLDALSTPEAESAEDLVSSTQRELVEEEGISASVEDVSPLVDLGFSAPAPVAAAVAAVVPEETPSPPDTTEILQPLEPTPTPAPAPAPAPEPAPEPAPAPAPQITLPTKKSSPATSDSTCWLQNVDPRVIDLVYWRDPKKSGLVFGSVLVLLLSLALFSVLSVVAYLSLAALTVTCTFVVYKKVLGAVQKAQDGHPFKQFLEYDVSLPEEKLHQVADVVMKNSTSTLKELRRLFLVEDLVDSLKFGLLLWVLTYLGSWFNGMTLIILAVVGVFTIPKFYETYKVQIDQYLDLASTQVKNVIAQVREKIPLGKKKKEE